MGRGAAIGAAVAGGAGAEEALGTGLGALSDAGAGALAREHAPSAVTAKRMIRMASE
jgi:hypothetical protein